jgi:putative oxidoreductase
MLGTIFMVSGARAVAEPHRLVPRAKPVTDRMTPLLEKADSRLPTDPATLVRLNGALQAGAGLLMLTRFSRPAALVLAGSMVPTTVAGHPFWAVDSKAEARVQQTQFLKNLAIMGGLLLAGMDTEGRPGLAWRTRRMASDTRGRSRRMAKDARHRVSDAQWRTRHLAGDAKRELRATTGKARVAARAVQVGRKLPG